MNIGGGEAADQLVRMMLSFGEVSVRLGGSALKNVLALSMALAKNNKDGAGEVFLQVRPQRTADLRGVRNALQALYLGQERQKADRLAVCLPAGVRHEILPRLTQHG